MTSFRRELHLVGTMADLARIGAFIEEACAQAHIDPAARFDLMMAVDEACSNIFEHAYNGLAGEVTLRFETRGRDVVITVRDHGRAFDPDGVPPPDMALPLEERPIGGLGLHLMRQLMDDISFTFSPEHGNILVMAKHGVAPVDPPTPTIGRRRSPARPKP